MENMKQELEYEPVHEDQDRFWSTYDIAIASTAQCLGHKLEHIDRERHPTKALFIFENTDDLCQFVQAFYSDEISVSPRQLFDAHKLMKNRIYASQ